MNDGLIVLSVGEIVCALPDITEQEVFGELLIKILEHRIQNMQKFLNKMESINNER